MKTIHFSKCLGLAFAFTFITLSGFSQSQQQESLEKLKTGNQRFCSGQMLHNNQDQATVANLKTAQHPFAIVISCSDSRVTPEIVFDQGLGDIFSIRTAGNVMSDYEEGSIEYAAEHLKTPLVVVMGHLGCGAVKAFLDYAENKRNHRNELEHGGANEHKEIAGHIQHILSKLENEEEEKEVLAQPGDHYDLAVLANVINGVKQLRKSDPILSKMYKAGEINIVGAVYHIENGEVEFLEM